MVSLPASMMPSSRWRILRYISSKIRTFEKNSQKKRLLRKRKNSAKLGVPQLRNACVKPTFFPWAQFGPTASPRGRRIRPSSSSESAFRPGVEPPSSPCTTSASVQSAGQPPTPPSPRRPRAYLLPPPAQAPRAAPSEGAAISRTVPGGGPLAAARERAGAPSGITSGELLPARRSGFLTIPPHAFGSPATYLNFRVWYAIDCVPPSCIRSGSIVFCLVLKLGCWCDRKAYTLV
jgi:hypothetical protein